MVSSDSTFQDLDQSAEPPAAVPAAGSFAPTLSPTITSAPSTAGGVPVSAAPEDSTHALAPELVKLDVRRATEVVVPTATMLGQTVSIKGNGAEMVGGVEGAVDRIAIEIVRHLEQGPTLVVWAFDASGSLQAERQRLSKHIETVYTHIKQLDESNLVGRQRPADDGRQPSARTASPCSPSRRPSGPRSSRPSTMSSRTRPASRPRSPPSPRSSTSGAATRTRKNQTYRTMVIVVTDEVGDDEGRLEDAIASAQKAKVPVYVLGSQAIFGRTENYVNYVDPKTKHVFYGAPGATRGPKASCSSRSACRSGTAVPQYEIVESGFGPYALSRLATATGGIYFVTRFDTRRMGFDPARMREYQPDWDRREKYEKQIQRLPLAPGGPQRRA